MSEIIPGRPRSMAALRLRDKGFEILCILVASVAVAILAILLGSIVWSGREHLDLSFLKSPPSRKPDKAGMMPAILGSVGICAVCALSALPIGVGTAVFLEEIRPKHRVSQKIHAFIEMNIRNLAGVPSIVYGVLGLSIFVQMFDVFGTMMDPMLQFGDPTTWFYFQLPFGRSVLAGGLTLMLVILPIVIISTQEAIRAVPNSLRQAAFGLGSTRLKVILRVTLPAATPGILTGAILAISRAIGEAAPILVIGGIVFIRFAPANVFDDFTAMPLQIFDWASRPQEEFHRLASTGIIVLLAILLTFNAVAVFLRQKLQKPLQ